MNPGLGLHLFLLEIKKILSYRVEFWIGFLGSLLSQFGVAFFLWKAIFAAQGAERVGGYTFGALMFYYLLVPLTNRVIHGQEMGGISGEIYDGGLSKYLVYPVSYFRCKYLSNLAHSCVFLMQMLLAIVLFMLAFRTPLQAGWLGLAKALPVLWLAGLLYFAMLATVEIVAFWADNVWSINVLNQMITNLLGGGLIPLAFFPRQAQAILEYLPYSRLISFPIRCLLGQVGTAEWLRGLALTAAWALAFWGLAFLLWRRGLRTYSGVGQ